MTIRVKFFASLREQIIDPNTEVDGAQAKTISDVWKLATDHPMPPHVLCSVNLDHKEPDAAVADGDEVAFFPPIMIKSEVFDPASMQAAHEANLEKGRFGATASFIGSMRNVNEGDDVTGMMLEHYPGMTEKELAAIIDDARSQWPIDDALIVHRVGDIQPGEPIVLTVVWSAHRAAAFDACRFLMEALKSRAPFWKKETLKDGTLDKFVHYAGCVNSTQYIAFPVLFEPVITR